MNAAQFSQSRVKRRNAMALVMVITVVALMSILMVAIFSVTRMEYKSTQAYVASKSAKQLGDIGTAIVQAQIENGQNTSTSASRTTHATQPGMVRTYNSDGSFNAAYKLYSSSNMKVVGSESSLYSDQHVPPSTWNALTARYVDLNEPVVRPGLTAGTYAVYFPIIDPRAAWNYGGGGQGSSTQVGTTQVEGFSYSKSAPTVGSGGGQDYSAQVITPTDTGNPDNLRLPMPVEWLYILEDGTVGALDAGNAFVSSGSSTASVDNPIVGRIAFWTDDESCKVNINTASEPTFLNSPFYFHERDARWAHFPGVTGEYQRYPGHPATVALSAVLAPNYMFDPLLPSLDGFSSFMDIVSLKEKIYKVAPKVTGGGSEEGTRPFAQDDFSGQNGERSSAARIDLSTASKERLYATVDEMLFADLEFNAQNGRSQNGYTQDVNDFKLPNGTDFINHDILERSRFFLTAQSRSPEFNIHGLPRVCMWPVADENILQPKWRTSFDNLIAYCSTIQRNSNNAGGYDRSYIFRRANARSASADMNITRNTQLLDYLVDQMTQLSWPATSYNSNSGFNNYVSKYGQDNVNQLAIQFFDYIRCTNLYDGITARNNDAWAMSNTGGTKTPYDLYNYRDSNVDNCYTFTSQRISPQPRSLDVSGDNASSNTQTTQASGTLPGHGSVSPATWQKSGRSYKGFGRMVTISEIGFQFICTADGLTDSGSLTKDTWNEAQPWGLGGGTAWRYGDGPFAPIRPVSDAYPNLTMGDGGQNAAWFSNFPPLLSQTDIDNAMDAYGCSTNSRFPERHPSRHPGFYGKNWNMTLAQGTWLQPGEKRIQVMLLMELFCPSVGYTGIHPEYTIVLDGSRIAGMNVVNSEGKPQPMFSTTGDIVLKSYNNVYSNGHTADILGGHAGPSVVSGGRRTRAVSLGAGTGGPVLMGSDLGYEKDNTSGHNAMQNYAFCSDFITVNRGSNLTVTFPSDDITVSIYDTHNWENAQPIQILHVNFGSLSPSIPMPNLPRSHPYIETNDSFGRITYTRVRQGPHDWVANYSGCLERMKANPNPDFGTSDDATFWIEPNGPQAVNPESNANTNHFQGLRGRLDTASALITDQRANTTARAISVIAPTGLNADGSNPDGTFGTDVIRSIVPAMGDYRTLAARRDVPSSWWLPHPFAGDSSLYQAHSFTNSLADFEPGVKLAQDSADNTTGANSNYRNQWKINYQMIGGAHFEVDRNGNVLNGVNPRQSDLPPGLDYAVAANAFGDFDTGVGNAREGPYINKPDEGNFYAGNEVVNGQTRFYRSAYFFDTWQNADDWRSGIYMTPNRMISSPVMFGSLPTGVWGNPSSLPSGSTANGDFAPWQTLLFRPHAQITSAEPYSQPSHPGMQDPSDHYLLDLFFMPVVEPYAISEPLSVAGRVNMNYQIMPFTNIRRATGMHAVMKGEYLTAIPNAHIVQAKNYYPSSDAAPWDQRFWNDSGDKRYWHRPIDVAATLRQFDLKFSHQSGGQDSYQGLFRSASQICEMHLIPKIKGDNNGTVDPDSAVNSSNQADINQIMNNFWAANRPTGDNVRERPYSNLYARLTTRSNTFRVHVRAQVLKKARSTDPTIFNPAVDSVISEYRGSTLLERYIDPNDTTVTIPDYANSGINQTPLDTFYRFHALETKRFNP